VSDRFKFYQCCQSPGESVQEFITTLKKLASHCEFDTFLDDALHDRLIVGLADEACQRKLMGESSLTFQKACERALDSELVKNQSNKINDKSQVNWIAKNYKNKPRSGSGRFKEKTSAVAVSGSSQSTNKSGDKSKRSGRAYSQTSRDQIRVNVTGVEELMMLVPDSKAMGVFQLQTKKTCIDNV